MANLRIGIFGGTFDPPHIGHLILAEEAAFQLDLAQVVWLLTPVSPFKLEAEISPTHQRLELLEAAVRGNSKFEISQVDIERPGPHFAYESLKILREKYDGKRLTYLIGGDSLQDLPKWEKPAELLKLCDQVGVMRRPGAAVDLEQLEVELPGLKTKLSWIETPLIDISGRAIRRRFRTGKPVRYYLPGTVYELILARGYYAE